MPGQIIKEPFWTSMVERNENMNTVEAIWRT